MPQRRSLPRGRGKTRNSRHPEHVNWTTVGDIGTSTPTVTCTDDRSSFMITPAGEHLPAEIENCLILHGKVDDVAVFGLPTRMGSSCRRSCSSRRVEPGRRSRQLRAFAREHLAGYKCRAGLTQEQLPRLETGSSPVPARREYVGASAPRYLLRSQAGVSTKGYPCNVRDRNAPGLVHRGPSRPGRTAACRWPGPHLLPAWGPGAARWCWSTAPPRTRAGGITSLRSWPLPARDGGLRVAALSMSGHGTVTGGTATASPVADEVMAVAAPRIAGADHHRPQPRGAVATYTARRSALPADRRGR